MSMFTGRLQSVIAVAALALCVSVAKANMIQGPAVVIGDAVPLSELLDDGELQVGDKLFTDFTYDVIGNMPVASAVNVIPIQDAMGNYGFRLQGGFLDLPGDGASDALLTYVVTVLDPNLWISDAHLVANASVVGDSDGIAIVTETFQPSGGNANMSVFDNGTVQQLVDWVDFDQLHRSLQVQKDILLEAGRASAGASISFIDQTFSQVPEPATIALLGIGGATMLFGRRRKA